MDALGIVSRARRGVVLASAGGLGCVAHGLLFALAQYAWGGLGAHLLVVAVLSSLTVVAGLTWLAPGSVWWWSADRAERTALRDEPPSAWGSLLRLSLALSRTPTAREAALRDALRLHAVLASVVLGVAIPLALGGLWWALLAPVLLFVVLMPLVMGAIVRRADLGYAQHREALDSAVVSAPNEPPPTARRLLTCLSGASAVALCCVVWHLGEPAPAALGGSCAEDPSAARVTLPSALPGTPLSLRADREAVTLTADDGGGPGRVVLAWPPLTRFGPRGGSSASSTSSRPSGSSANASPSRDALAPTFAWVRATPSQVRVTLCAEPTTRAQAQAHELLLAPRGYRLDDGVAARVLRSPLGALLALTLLLLTLAYSRWGWPALLRTFTGEATSARAAVTWTVLFGGAQLAWVLATALGA